MIKGKDCKTAVLFYLTAVFRWGEGIKYAWWGQISNTMKDTAYFYKTAQWQNTRDAYAKSKRNLCEVCLAKGLYKYGDIVHHKVHITPETVNNPEVTLSWDNLQLLCRDCHGDMHRRVKKRYTVDALGRVTAPIDEN